MINRKTSDQYKHPCGKVSNKVEDGTSAHEGEIKREPTNEQATMNKNL